MQIKKRQNSRTFKKRAKYDNIAYLFILPMVLFFCAFFVYPLAHTVWLSFQEWTGFSPTNIHFVGTANYQTVFDDWVFWKSVKNTIAFAFLLTVVQTIVALILALTLDSPLRGGKVFNVIFFTPVLTSISVVSLLWGRIFEPNFGLLNGLLRGIGLGVLARPWLGDASAALYVIVAISVWHRAGYSMVLFLAGLQDISEDLKEAAMIDGAGPLRVIWSVTLPLLRPVIGTVAGLTLIGGFKVFEIVYIMTTGGPNHATETIASLLYYEAFRFNRMGVASAIGVLLLILTMGMSLLQRRLIGQGENLT